MSLSRLKDMSVHAQHIMSIWLEERAKAPFKKYVTNLRDEFFGNSEFSSENFNDDKNLALNETVDREAAADPVSLAAQVLKMRKEYQERGQISVAYICRKLKCSYSAAFDIFQEVMKPFIK